MDHYDRDYRHLIHELEIAGAYRIGEVARVMGLDGEIYTSDLFKFNPSMQSYLPISIELGRSFVSPQYWGKLSLDYLWYSIGAYLKRYPEIRYLFGPASLSHSYPGFTKALIVNFYQKHFADT